MADQVHVAIPACDEEKLLPRVLERLSLQRYLKFTVWVCVNQPEAWWDREDARGICESNQRLLQYLQKNQSTFPFELRILDCSSRGHGWADDFMGASRARKMLMDSIVAESDSKDIIMSLDADTMVNEAYIEEGVEAFGRYPRVAAVTFPFYHILEGNEATQKAMIRYETYLRNYLLGMMEIRSPYAYLPIGSAFAVRVWAYKAVRGMPIVAAGEDFYFLQKVRQVGFIVPMWSPVVYPSGRLSHRVLFGTGRSLMFAFDELCRRYPLFPSHAFEKVRQILEEIYQVALTRSVNEAKNLLSYVPLKKVDAILHNFKRPHHIEHALHIQFNALETYHALKDALQPYDESQAFLELLKKTNLLDVVPHLWESSLEQLESFRRKLFDMECNFVRKKLENLRQKNKTWWKYLTCW